MRSKKFRKQANTPVPQLMRQYEPMIRRWILRMLIPGGLHQPFIERPGIFHDDDVLRLIGLEELDGEKLSRDETIRVIENRWRETESEGDLEVVDGPLEKNLLRLQEALGLSDHECGILHFLILLEGSSVLDNTADMAGELNTESAARLISITLDYPLSLVRKSLHRRSLLHSSGLLQVEKSTYRLSRKFDLLDGLEDQIFSTQESMLDMVSHLITPAGAVSLHLQDFDHIASKRDRIRTYLQQVIQHQVDGVNILIHGEPGVGKSELVRTLVQAVGDTQLYELSTADEDGDAMSGRERFKAYQLSQKLLANKGGAVILFDEIEDVFPSDPFAALFGGGRGSSDGKQKGWINELLEQNPVPAFWVSNAIEQMDPAYLRRFDMVVEIPPMTHRARSLMLRKLLHDLPVSEGWIDKIAHHKHLHPGQIKRAQKVVHYLTNESTDSNIVEQELETLIGETQVAMGNSKSPNSAPIMATPYSLDFLNADTDLNQLANGLQKTESARICLYGKPGTGKSGYANHLAKILDKPLISKKGSELLGMYVGQTEQQISRMFQQAEEENAILLLDEGDSFLRDRNSANQSWEVTQVNELLTQMESFDGIFIISTNLMKNLDAASLRRFDFKIRFSAMKPDQRWAMFRKVAAEHQVTRGVRSKKIEQEVRSIEHLTPGDFSTVVRRARVMGGFENAAAIAAALQEECNAKPGATRRIGFV